MLLFFAGGEGFSDLLIKGGVKNCLESFWSLKMVNPCHQNLYENHLLDSGGFSARQRGVEIDVRKYAEYLKRWNIKFAFNLDVKDLATSLANQKYLEEHTDTYIIPIYHGPEWKDEKTRDLLDYYVENYPYIGLGGIAGKEVNQENRMRFLNYCFARTKDKTWVHGLGVTGENALKKYPFATVDSTSWLSVSKFGQSAVYSIQMSKVRARNRHYTENLLGDIPYFIKLGEDMTRLWERRGIMWGNLDYEKFMAERGKVKSYEEWKNARV